jgi:hypothetical protein
MQGHTGRSLQICIAVVLLAHGALVCSVLGATAFADVAQVPLSTRHLQLVEVGLLSSPVPALAAKVEDFSRMRETIPEAARLAAPDPAALATTSIVTFKSPRDLESVARPRSAPDISILDGLPWSGLPMRLRLFVDARGNVVDVVVLSTGDDDIVVQRVRQMFLSAAFVSGRANGTDVASYKDVEITVGTPGRDVQQAALGPPGHYPMGVDETYEGR